MVASAVKRQRVQKCFRSVHVYFQWKYVHPDDHEEKRQPAIRLRSQTMQLHAKNNILLKPLKSGARCLNFSLEVIDWNIRNPKLVPAGEMTDENNSYISNLFVDSDVHSVILILDTCKGIQFLYKYLIQDNTGFWVSRRGFRIPGTGFRTLSIELLSSVRFRIPWAVIDSGSQSRRFLQI